MAVTAFILRRVATSAFLILLVLTLTFFVIRIVYFPLFVRDVALYRPEPWNEGLGRPGQGLIFTLIALQSYWFTLIVRKALRSTTK